MGYGEYGGGGSVHWLNDADDIDEIAGATDQGSAWPKHGVDYPGKKPTPGDFTIRVKLPENRKERAAWLDALRKKLAGLEQKAGPADDILEFTLPIEESPQPHAQIQVCWGKTIAWQDNLSRLPPGYQGAAVAAE
jgi:hypothetical protein